MDEILNQMQTQVKLSQGDPEAAHGVADKMLLDLIAVLSEGQSEKIQGKVVEIMKAYREVKKHYA